MEGTKMENPITNIPETIKALQEQITTLKNSETPYQAQIFQKNWTKSYNNWTF